MLYQLCEDLVSIFVQHQILLRDHELLELLQVLSVVYQQFSSDFGENMRYLEGVEIFPKKLWICLFPLYVRWLLLFYCLQSMILLIYGLIRLLQLQLQLLHFLQQRTHAGLLIFALLAVR